MKNIIEVLIGEFSKEIKDKKLTVTIEHGDSWPVVKADPERIKDAFSVIIDNAIQYNREVRND